MVSVIRSESVSLQKLMLGSYSSKCSNKSITRSLAIRSFVEIPGLYLFFQVNNGSAFCALISYFTAQCYVVMSSVNRILKVSNILTIANTLVPIFTGMFICFTSNCPTIRQFNVGYLSRKCVISIVTCQHYNTN